MKKEFGNFGKLVSNYNSTRPNYPSKVIKFVLTEIKKSNPLILDLGCGTGIGTRQLASLAATVIGCDIDSDMLNVAVRSAGKNVSYIKGDAEKIPFADKTFDAVTIFNAFHWFTTKKALDEIKRVLRPKGTLCVIQRKSKSPFRNDFRNIVEQALKSKVFPKYNTKTEFASFLVFNKFNNVRKTVVKTVDKYTLNQYLNLWQSYSIWNDVPPRKQTEVLKAARKHFSQKLDKGHIRDPWDVEIIFANK